MAKSFGTIELPPMVDLHVHFDRGTNKAETIESGSIAAAYGGVGFANDMSNTPGAPTATKVLLDGKIETAEAKAAIGMGFAFSMQPEYQNLAEVDEYTLRKALMIKLYGGPTTGIERATDYEAHEFDEGLDKVKRINPSILLEFHSGEENYRDLIGHAAGDRGLRVDLAHVNKVDQVCAAKEARDRGWDVRTEVCGQTILLTTHDYMTRSSFADMQPPLTDADEAMQLYQALIDGDIDRIATDHAPHLEESKFDAALRDPLCDSKEHGVRCCGVASVDHAMQVWLWQVFGTKKLPLERLVEAYSTFPAERIGLTFSPGSKVIWDLEAFRLKEENEFVKSGARWSPFLGMMAVGQVKEMKLAGRTILKNGEIIQRLGRVIGSAGGII